MNARRRHKAVQWRDGEMLRRSTAFGAQREIVERAKARVKALDAQADHAVR